MKNLVIFLLLLYGCGKGEHISGMYVKHVESEYSVGEDTVFISHADGHYIMERHTGYSRVTNGALSGKQLKVQRSVLSPTSDLQWQDTRTGTLLTFGQDNLQLGTAKYQKINKP